MPQASSPLKSELLSSSSPSSSTTSSSSSPQTTDKLALEHERHYNAMNKQEQQREASELEDFRKLALEKQSEGGSGGGGGGSSFEPFVGSRVGSPIPDRNGLGWPGAFSSSSFSVVSPNQ